MTKRKKISLIGGGNIGGTLAFTIASKGIADVVIFDPRDNFAKGKALDIEQSLPVNRQEINLIGTKNPVDLRDSDVVIITAGISRKPGMNRNDLLSANKNIIKSVAKDVKKYTPNAFVIIITNPLDAMLYAFLYYSGLSRDKVVGMAGVLDTARYKLFLARELNISVSDISALVLGGHGDTMVPLLKYTSISGIPLLDLVQQGQISEKKLSAITERTKKGGGEIVKLLESGSAFYAPAASALEIAESYIFDKRKTLPCSILLQGEYNINESCMGVPVIIGQNGIEKIIILQLDQQERKYFDRSAQTVNDLIKDMKKIL